MLRDNRNRPFTSSWTTYHELNEDYPFDTSLKIYVPVEVPALNVRVRALLDTGAPWTIMGPDLVEELNLRGRGGERARLSTRDGLKDGSLERVTLTLLADPGGGDSLEVDTTVFVCDWPCDGAIILGYQGFIQRLRIALDPGAFRLHFGPC